MNLGCTEFTESQKHAFDELENFLNNSEKEIIVTGSPGFGKSFLINEFCKKHDDVILTATTNKASDIINGVTIYSLLGLTLKDNHSTGKTSINYEDAQVVRNSVIVIDECSMIHEELYKALKTYTINCKFIYVGDFYQLPPVNSNFSIFALGIKTLELKEPCRTQNEDILNILSNIKHAIRTKSKFLGYKDSENFIILRTHDEVLEHLKNFEVQRDKILAYTNDVVLDENLKMRDILGKGKVFEDGDFVVCKSVVKDRHYGVYTKIENIKHIDHILRENRDGTHMVSFTDGTRYKMFLDSKKYKEKLVELANICENGESWKKYFDYKGDVLDARDVYCSTVHCSQGSTYRNVYINIRDIFKNWNSEELMRLMYVAVSRAKEKVYILNVNNSR